MADSGTGAGMIAMAAASITVAGIQAAATTDAAGIQTKSADRTADLIDARFQLMRTDFVPYRDIGVVATGQMSDRLNEFTTTDNPYAPAMDAEMPIVPPLLTQELLENIPGWQFVRDTGLRATQNAMAARGLGVSGAALRAAATFVTGLADATYTSRFAQQQALFGNQQQRFANIGMRFGWDQGLKVNAFNRLNSVLTTGQNSAAQVGKAGMDSANQAGNALMNGANGAAGAVLAGAASIGSGINGAVNAYSSYQQQQAYGINGGSSSYAGTSGYGSYSNGQLDAINKGQWTAADQSAASSYKDT